MGSYLTIVNDTNYPMYCKMEQKHRSTWDKIGRAILDDFKKTLIAAGFVMAPDFLVSSSDNVDGVDVFYDIYNTNIPSNTVNNSNFNVNHAMAQTLSRVLSHQEFSFIAPGQSLKYGKYHLSELKYASCKKFDISVVQESRVNVINVKIETARLKMTSAAIKNKNSEYKIQSTIDKYGMYKEKIHLHHFGTG